MLFQQIPRLTKEVIDFEEKLGGEKRKNETHEEEDYQRCGPDVEGKGIIDCFIKKISIEQLN